MTQRKWLIAGTLAVVFVVGIFSAIRYMAPLVLIDGANQRIRVLGGLIDVDGKAGTVKVGGATVTQVEDKEYRRFEGSRVLDRSSVRRINVPFTNGKIELSDSDDGAFHWACNLGSKDKGSFSFGDHDVTLDLGRARSASCGLQVPAGLEIALKGANGELIVRQPRYNLSADIANGKIELLPDPTQHYRYDLSVTKGKIDKFDSSDAGDAHRIALTLINGAITRN